MWLICCPQALGNWSQPAGIPQEKGVVRRHGRAGQGMLLMGGCLSSMVAGLSASEKETRGKRTIASLMGQQFERNMPLTVMQHNCTCFSDADRECQLDSRSLRERRKFSGEGWPSPGRGGLLAHFSVEASF